MPLWSSVQKDYSEHAPLSAHDDDDEEEPPLPPYSDNPATPARSPYSDNPAPQDTGNGAAVRRTNGRSSNGATAASSAHKAITVNGGEYEDDEDDEDPGFGEGDFYRSGSGGISAGSSSHRYSSTPSKHKRNKPQQRYRTGLICAYLDYGLTCCGALGGGRMKRICMCLFYMVLFVTMMVCASAIGYIIARDGSPFESDQVTSTVVDAGKNNSGSSNANVGFVPTVDNGGGKTFDKQINAAKLPPPPLNLYEICSDWITITGRQKCQSECSVADCCSLPASNKNSCWEAQAAECATYRAACMALELHTADDPSGSGGGDGGSSSGGGIIGPKTILYAPPSNLPILCSSLSLETPEGFNSCEGICRPSRCCYPDLFACNLADDRYCEDYEDLCASVAESWRGSGHAVAPSSTSSSSTSGETTSSQNPAIANEVMQKCNSANLNPPNECIEACKAGACCYVSSSYLPIEQLFNDYYGVAKSPFRAVNSCASNIGFCQQYGSCEHLNQMKDVAGWNSDEVNYVVDVSTPCKAEHIAQFGALQCSNVCQPAHCCFSGEYACDDVQLGHLNCEDYKACQVLYPNKNVSTKELLKLAERIDEVCSASSLKTIGGRAECQDVCSDHLCCFYQDGCTNDPDKNCLAYAGCETYYNLPTDGGQVSSNNNNNNIAGGSIGSDLGVDEFVTALEEACSEESLRTINGIYKCHNKCQAHLCCFVPDGDQAQQDCSNQRPAACSVYEPCKRLVNPIQGIHSVKSLEPADIEKIVYDNCYFGADPLKITQEMVTKCHGVCAQRLCCFSDYLLQSSCRATVGDNECELYSLCEQLVADDGMEVDDALELQEKEFDVAHLCTSKVNEDQNLYDACAGLCREKRSCCFDIPVYSCYELEKDWCDEYKACERVNLKFQSEGGGNMSNSNDGTSGGSITSSSTPQEIEKAVYDACYFGDDESRVTQGLITKCHNVCQSRLCCFSSYKLESSCRTSVGDEECELYSLCEQLINKNGGEVKDFIELDLQEFDNGTPAISTPQEIEKAVYDACYFGDDESRVTQGLITKCHNVCQSRLCCFSSYKLESSCRASVGDEECELYSLCEQLINKNGGEMKNFIELDLQEFDNGTPDMSTSDQMIEKDIYDACYFGDDESRVTQELITKCHNVCQSRLCCFSSYKLESSCRASVGDEECELYSLCEQLITEDGDVVKNFIELDLKEFGIDTSNSNSASGPGSTVQYPSGSTGVNVENEVDSFVTSLESACAENSLKTLDGLQRCHSKCQAHLCCFTTDSKLADQDCSGLIPAACSAYEPCKRLVTPPVGTDQDASPTSLSSNEATEKRVYDACYFGEDPTKVTEELVTKCHGVCAQRLCCFSDYILQSSCRATIGDDECELYSLCEQLVTQSGVAHDALELEENEFGVDQLCTEKVATNSNLFSACSETCEMRSCCFETSPTYSCYSMEKDWCDEYKACAVVGYAFHDEGSSSNGSLDRSTGSSSSEEELYASIESVCSLDSLKTLEGIERCFNKCQSYLCCFPEDAAEMKWNCDGFREEECMAYGNCEQLVALHNLWKPPPKAVDKYAVKIAVNNACILGDGVQPTEEWVSNCHEKCESRMCCLVDPSIRSSCLDALGAEECNDYSSCKVLIGGGSTGAEQIEDVCSDVNDASSFAKCEAKCKTRQCCFEDVHKFSCYHLEKEWCDEYEVCGMVGLKFSSPSVTISSTGVQNAPSPSQSSNQNTLSAPTTSVTPGMPNNYGSGPSFTSGSSIENHQDSIEAMTSRCAPHNLPENLEDCGKWCQHYECCFYFSNSCFDTQPQQCNDHLLCENVFDELKKGAKSNNESSSGNKIDDAPMSAQPVVNTPPQSSQGDSDSELLILARACNVDQLDIDATECRMLCKGSECCFTTDIANNCSRKTGMQAFCLEHMLCADLSKT